MFKKTTLRAKFVAMIGVTSALIVALAAIAEYSEKNLTKLFD
ncbi:MAG: hypothetical protein VW338_04580 [Rhodospirillaceae bacterium]